MTKRHVPNSETIKAMKAARQGKVAVVGKPESLLSHLKGKADFTAFDRIVRRKGGELPRPEDKLDQN